ncbi:HAD-IIB family hydrolase [Allobaculum sp. JKK-2023]|uniref:HAD-IIB family hydrolase n=1 Tax=Allobaculum sp. JKK-2023 TaxID=3108943 RepID=UPI002B054285|nr:HAD-IIB family hydrolase [Allobaculum sp. JKK-2023]
MIVFGTDFDDTLYFHSGKELGVRQKDLDAIARFKNAGNQFGLISGRARCMMPEIDELLSGKVKFDFMIFSNGACICDQEGKILWEHFMPEEVVRDVFEQAAKDKIGIVLHGTECLYQTQEMDFQNAIHVTSIDEFDPSRIYSISFHPLSEVEKDFFRTNQNRQDVVVVANSQFADFNANEITKGTALNRLTHMMSQSENLSAAIGDSFNDESMLKDADISFTFETSDPSVKKCAACIVDGIHEAVDILLDPKQLAANCRR